MRLIFRGTTDLPLDLDRIDPSVVRDRNAVDVARLSVPVGNQTAEIGDLFEVDDSGPESLTFVGDLSHARGLGSRMTEGSLVIRGNAGQGVGSGMTGGAIDVHGDVGDFAGAEIRGGRLTIHGSAGYGLGTAYPGSRIGMRDGVILVHGSAGQDVGFKMRRGLIAVLGDVGDSLGRGLIAGSIFVFGGVGRYPGLGMKRGTIGLFGTGMPDFLPWFEPTGRFRLPFLSIYLRQVARWGFPVPPEIFDEEVDRYNGDVIEGGIGEILVGNAGGTRRVVDES